jgi:hypothetical protein
MGCYPDAVLALACRNFHQMDYFPDEGLLVLPSGLALALVPRSAPQWIFQVHSTVPTVLLLPQGQQRSRQLLRILQLDLELLLF